MNSEKLLVTLLAALAINEFIHIFFEIWGMRQKVAWLRARLDKKPHGDWPIDINTLTKVLIVHLVLFCFFVGLAFAVLLVLNLSIHTLLLLSIIVLIVTYANTVLSVDVCHTEIGQIINRYKRHYKK